MLGGRANGTFVTRLDVRRKEKHKVCVGEWGDKGTVQITATIFRMNSLGLLI